MKDVLRRVLRVLLPVLVIGVGVAIFMALVRTKPEPSRVKTESKGTLVEVEEARAGSQRIVVEAQGAVVAARQVGITPEVNGRVAWTSDALVVGGRVSAGEPLLRIDPRDYRIAVQQRSAEVSQARLALEQEKSRKHVAEREWRLFEDESEDATELGRALALREPFVDNAEAAVEAAESSLQRARLDLSRTTLRSPFNAVVQSETVEVGQVVGPQAPVATLVGTDRFWVQVSVPMEALPWLRFPEGDTPGSAARIVQEAGRARQERAGRVLRLLGDLDPVGRMARVIVEVPDPMSDRLPLLVGSYVSVAMEGPEVEDVIEVPRVALREGDKVFVMAEDDTLAVREVELLWRRETSVLVEAGLEDGERIVTSRIPTPVEGMKLRVAETPATETGRGAPRAEAR